MATSCFLLCLVRVGAGQVEGRRRRHPLQAFAVSRLIMTAYLYPIPDSAPIIPRVNNYSLTIDCRSGESLPINVVTSLNYYEIYIKLYVMKKRFATNRGIHV